MKYATVTAKTVIFNNEGSLLLMRRHPKSKTRPGEFDLPGGKVDDGEDVFEGAIREIKEETGLSLSKNQIDIVFSESETNHEKIKCRIIFLAVLYETPEIKLSEEHIDFEWITIEEAVKTYKYPPHNRVFKLIIAKKLTPLPVFSS